MTHEEAEEDDEIEKQLVEHITEHALSLQVAPAAEEPDEAADTDTSVFVQDVANLLTLCFSQE